MTRPELLLTTCVCVDLVRHASATCPRRADPDRARRIPADRQRSLTATRHIYPNLWAGYGLVRGGAGTALVGSHEEVADRIAEYHALGLDHFILSGQPHLEEAYWFGEGVIPLLRERGLLAGAGTERELVSA